MTRSVCVCAWCALASRSRARKSVDAQGWFPETRKPPCVYAPLNNNNRDNTTDNVDFYVSKLVGKSMLVGQFSLCLMAVEEAK